MVIFATYFLMQDCLVWKPWAYSAVLINSGQSLEKPTSNSSLEKWPSQISLYCARTLVQWLFFELSQPIRGQLQAWMKLTVFPNGEWSGLPIKLSSFAGLSSQTAGHGGLYGDSHANILGIVHYLGLQKPFEMVTGFDRPTFSLPEEPSDKMRRLKELLASGKA